MGYRAFFRERWGYVPRQTRSLMVVFALGTIYLFSSDYAQAQEKVLRTLTVTGQGIETISTTLTRVQLGVEVQGKTAQEVQQEVARRTSAVVELLRSRNVQKLQTTGITLQPNYDFSQRERRLIGYIGTNTISFRLETERAGAMLDSAVQAGATRIDGISFTAEENAISAAQKQALTKASEDALAQGDTILKSLNLSRKDIVSIQVNAASAPQPLMIQSEQMAKVADITPVIGGEQQVQASVTLQISY
jgi:uncharacterized protein